MTTDKTDRQTDRLFNVDGQQQLYIGELLWTSASVVCDLASPLFPFPQNPEAAALVLVVVVAILCEPSLNAEPASA